MTTTFDGAFELARLTADLNAAGRRLAAQLRQRAPELADPRVSAMATRLACTAEARRLRAPGARAEVAALLDRLGALIRCGTSVREDWFEAGYSDGGCDYAMRTVEVLSPAALAAREIAADAQALIERLEKIDDLRDALESVGDRRDRH